jgi:uncharacterized membrane protein YqjE
MSVGEAYSRLKDDADALLQAAKTVGGAYGGNLHAARRLFLADLILARTALVRGLVFLLICALLAGTGWVLLMVMLVLGMHQLGLGWLASLLVPFVLSLGLAWAAWKVAHNTLRYADFDASRRQLARWFPPKPSTAQPPPSQPAAPPPDGLPPVGRNPEVPVPDGHVATLSEPEP